MRRIPSTSDRPGLAAPMKLDPQTTQKTQSKTTTFIVEGDLKFLFLEPWRNRHWPHRSFVPSPSACFACSAGFFILQYGAGL